MAGKLQDKAAIVTGAGTGIGEAVAHKFARERARVLVFGLPEDPVEDVAASIRSQYGVDAIGVGGDAADETDAQDAVARAVEEFGRLDVLVNVAAAYPEIAEAQEFSMEGFDALVRNNCRTAFVMVKYALPHLQRSHGAIVSNGSVAAVLGEPNASPCGATKGFIHSLTRGLAHEQAKYGVRVNAVAPGVVDTGWLHPEAGAPFSQKTRDLFDDLAVMGRTGKPEEIANVYVFLAPDDASFVTGAVWPADGGLSFARGTAGEQADESFKTAPTGELQLSHSIDGQRNKHAINRL